MWCFKIELQASILINALIHKYLDDPLSILSETCLYGDEGREVNWPAKAWSIVTLVIFQVLHLSIFNTLSIYFDWTLGQADINIFSCLLSNVKAEIRKQELH